ncbi:MAG: PilZ domain-containing protein [Candidatus Acidiferrales bacterium]
MPNHERRVTARKSYTIPVRYNVITEQFATVGVAHALAAPERPSAKYLTTIPLPQLGEIVNLSERGVGFKTRQNLNVGESVEIFFTLPTALTGRAPEDVRCNARVVRVDKSADRDGLISVGAAIDRFERTTVSRNWDN